MTPKDKPNDWLAEFVPSEEGVNALVEARKIRLEQRKWTGYQHRARDEAEDLSMLLAWEAGEVSEGALSKVLDAGNRVKLRERKMRAIALGRSLAHALRAHSDTLQP